MKTLDNKFIIYDSNCKVCSAFRDVVLKYTSIPDEKIKALKDLNDDLSKQVDADKFRNVMALIDTHGERTLYGAEGVAYIFASEYKTLDVIFRFKPAFALFDFLYKTQAYNRYIMATPKSNFKCDCFPDRVVKYRISYITIALTISVLLTAWFGISLKKYFNNMSGTQAAIEMLLMAGSGWVLQILLAIILLRGKALDYIGHLGSIMVVGLLILIPSMLFYAVTGILTPWLPAVSVVFSSGYMLYLHILRAKYLEISQGWTVSWFLFLQSTALFWIYYFHLN